MEENFIQQKFWTIGVKEDIKNKISDLDKRNKIDFLNDIINYCQNLKTDLTTKWEYLIYDNRNDVPYKTYSNKAIAEEKLEELIYGNKSEHIHWEIKKIKNEK
jgi:hypothetical protein